MARVCRRDTRGYRGLTHARMPLTHPELAATLRSVAQMQAAPIKPLKTVKTVDFVDFETLITGTKRGYERLRASDARRKSCCTRCVEE
jgi:hypothetical protein